MRTELPEGIVGDDFITEEEKNKFLYTEVAGKTSAEWYEFGIEKGKEQAFSAVRERLKELIPD